MGEAMAGACLAPTWPPGATSGGGVGGRCRGAGRGAPGEGAALRRGGCGGVGRDARSSPLAAAECSLR